MRFPVVLFDFDGTVIDSGAIIIASMRHATKTVLGRDIPDEELGRAVGGSGLVEQMRLLDPERIDELVTVYREHNEPLHAEIAECVGMTDVLTRLKEEGRRLGIVTAKRQETVKLAFSYLPLEHFFDVVVGSDDTERHKPDPEPLQHALGLHTAISRVQGNKLKAKHEIRVASMFKDVPLEFLRMIAVHELAHVKEKQHDKAFYKLCTYMEPNYHQYEFDLRLYLTELELSGKRIW